MLKDEKCVTCGEQAEGYTLDGVPLCQSHGIVAEAQQTKDDLINNLRD